MPLPPSPPAPLRGGGPSCAGGFTLIELLVVLLIIGVLATLAVLTVGDPRADNLEREARRLAALMELAAEEAVIQGSELGIRVEHDGYSFWVYVPNEWLPLTDDKLLRARELPDEIYLDLEVEGVPRIGLGKEPEDAKKKDEEKKKRPHLFLLSSGELTPAFEIFVRDHELDHHYVLAGTAVGELSLSKAQ